MAYLAASIVTLMAILGIGLCLVTLPGAWLALATAVLCNFWVPGLFTWYTLGACLVLALLGEIIELAASAMGAAKAGGSKTGAAGAVVGTLVGAVVGTFVPPPPLGTILGAAIGAGMGAMLAERFIKKRELHQSAKIAAGAAAGRLVAVVIKTSLCVIIAGVLITAAFVP